MTCPNQKSEGTDAVLTQAAGLWSDRKMCSKSLNLLGQGAAPIRPPPDLLGPISDQWLKATGNSNRKHQKTNRLFAFVWDNLMPVLNSAFEVAANLFSHFLHRIHIKPNRSYWSRLSEPEKVPKSLKESHFQKDFHLLLLIPFTKGLRWGTQSFKIKV